MTLTIKFTKDKPHKTASTKPPRVFLWFYIDGEEVGQGSISEESLEAMKSGDVEFVEKT